MTATATATTIATAPASVTATAPAATTTSSAPTATATTATVPAASGSSTAATTTTTSTLTETTNGHANDSSSSTAPDIAEVGWLFVQQYYSFLNEQPHRLHLFYTIESTLLHGVEAEAAETRHGQPQIAQEIKEHGFEDCKVLVSNVDCQPSAQNGAVIQVLGEMSNKGGASQKFVQTFFLAPQPRGYYVLNDIFRFLKEDISPDFDDEATTTQAPQPQQIANGSVEATASSVPAPATLYSQTVPAPKQETLPTIPVEVTKPSEVTPASTITPVVTAAATTVKPSSTAEDVTPVTQPVVAAAESSGESEEQKQISNGSVEESKEVKEVKEPVAGSANPTSSTVIPSPAVPAPTAPVSWAALAAKNKKAEANANAASGTSSGDVSNSSITSGTTSNITVASSPVASTAASPIATVDHHHPSSTPSAPSSTHNVVKSQQPFTQGGIRKGTPIEYHSAYIKHVSNRVDDNLLRKALEKIGTMTHFQVEKTKNCAFVDFIDDATLKAALAVHELQVGDQVVLIEERKRGGAKKGGFQKKNSNGNSNNFGNGNFKKPIQKV